MKKYANSGVCGSNSLRAAKWLAFLILLFVGGLTYGQNTMGAIVGTATTPDGSAIEGATVTITNENTHAARTLTTGSQGEYAASALNPGTYDVVANAPGFATLQTTGIVVRTAQTVRTDLPLKVGNVSTQVVVTGGAPVIESQMSSISSTVTTEELATTSSNLIGTVDNTGNSGLRAYIVLLPSGHATADGTGFSMGGSRAGQAYYNVDGISSNSTLFGNADGSSFPSFDIVQEVKYDAVNNKAEMGQLLNMTVITKSGTNQLHGSLFYHYANQDLNAANYFSTSVPEFSNNDFGGGIGGPIKRRKMFFFASYEGRHANAPQTIAPNLPTLDFRQGDFSSLLTLPTPIVVKNPYTGQPFPGNIIPASLMASPQAQAALYWQDTFLPLPNFGPPDSHVGNFRATYPVKVIQSRYDLRLDANLAPKNTAFVRFSYGRAAPQSLTGGWPPEIVGRQFQVRKTYSGVLSDTWIITPNLINVAKVGAEHMENNNHPTITGQDVVDALGIQGFPVVSANAYGFPKLRVSGFSMPNYGGPADSKEQTIQVTDQLTYQHGNHTIKGGIEYRPTRGTRPYYPHFGNFTFNGSLTKYSYADFLLGLPQSTSYAYDSTSEYGLQYFINSFLQDDWRATPKLTISYGLRYEFMSGPVDKYDNISTFDPATGAIVVPSVENAQKYFPPGFPTEIPIVSAQDAGYPARSPWYAQKANFFPRIGFAYSLNDNTVVRGGYGVYNNQITIDLFGFTIQQAPYGGTVGYTNRLTPPPGDPACTVATPCTPAITFTQPLNADLGQLGAVNITGIDKNIRNPRTQQWNLTFERNIGFNTGLRLSYVGLYSSGLLYVRNLNQVPASATVPWSQANTSYPDYQVVSEVSNGGLQVYHAFTAEVTRHMHKNLMFRAALTWAKNLTDDPSLPDGDFQGGVTAEDTYDLHRQWGNDMFTPRWHFVSNLVYHLPIGPGQLLLSENNLLTKIIGGWQLSAAYLANSGNFLTPMFSGVDPTNTNAFGGSVDRTGVSMKPIGKKSINNWFNPAAFAIPQPGKFGNAGYGIIRGPGAQTLNAALFKSFPLPRNSSVEVSGSFTNVLNHPNFGDPDVTITDGGVGQITSTSSQAGFFGPRSGLLTVRFNF